MRLAWCGWVVVGMGLVGCGESESESHGSTHTSAPASAPASPPAEPPLDPALVAQGRATFDGFGCVACHLTAKPAEEPAFSIGPPLYGIAGTEAKLIDGRTVTRDDDYLRRSLKEPSADKVEGYYSEMVLSQEPTDAEVEALLAFIKSLRD